MTIEIFTIEDIRDQMADMFKLTLETDGDLKNYLFVRSLYDSGLTKDTLEKDLLGFIYKYGFIKPVETLNTNHLTHILIKNIVSSEWNIVYSAEESLFDLYEQSGKLVTILKEYLDDQKHGQFIFLDFDKKEIELFTKELH